MLLHALTAVIGTDPLGLVLRKHRSIATATIGGEDGSDDEDD